MSRCAIRTRLTLAFSLSVALILALGGLLFFSRATSELDRSLNDVLAQRAADLAHLAADPRASLSAGSRSALVEPSDDLAQLLSPRGTVLEATRALSRRGLLTPRELARALRAPLLIARREAGLEHPLRILASPARVRDKRGVVLVGVSLGARDETLASLRDELLIGLPAALALTILAGYLLARSALSPVRELESEARAISATDAAARLAEPRANDEIASLAQTLNALLGRVEEAREREQRFSADASHELRRPLTLMLNEIDVTLRGTGSIASYRRALTVTRSEVENLTRLTDDLLLLARSADAPIELDSERFDAHELLSRVARRHHSQARSLGRAIVVDKAQNLAIVGDRARLEQALANLTDNAIRHGAGTVTLAAEARDGRVALTVSDEGTGPPSEFMPRAFDRFSRADPSRHASGAGLGLAITRLIADAHAGSVQASGAPGAFTVTFALTWPPDPTLPPSSSTSA